MRWFLLSMCLVGCLPRITGYECKQMCEPRKVHALSATEKTTECVCEPEEKK